MNLSVLVDKSDRDGIGRHAGLRSLWLYSCGSSSLPDRTTFSDSSQPFWGIHLTKDEDGARKRYACHWIEVMRKLPELADKIRNNRLLEADLFIVRRECKWIVATMTRKVLPYRVSRGP